MAIEAFGHREGHFGDYTAHVSQELSRLGNSVTVVTSRIELKKHLSGDPGFRVIETLPRTESSGSRAGFISGGIRGMGLILDSIRVIRAGLRLYKKEVFDVVHIFDCEPVSTRVLLVVFSLFSRKKLKPLLMVVHAPDPSLQGHGNILYHVYGMFSRPALRSLLTRHADAVTAHGTWKSGELEKLLGINKDECRIYPVPYGTVIPKEKLHKGEARKKLGLDPHVPLLLFFGMLRKDKGVELLIQTMGKLKSDCRLLLTGMPFDFEKGEIEKLIQRHGAEERIIARLEYIPDEEIPDYFAAADAMVLPYRGQYMGAAGPLKAALGFGVPVIAAEVRELSHFLAAAPIGFSFPPDDGEALQKGIEKFLGLSGEEKEVFSKNGRTLAEGFSWPVVARRFIEVYREAGKS